MRHARGGLSILLLIVIATVIQAGTTGNRHTEDFSTKQFCDTTNTTAWWDTVSGELKLYPFVPTLAGSYDTPGIAWDV